MCNCFCKKKKTKATTTITIETVQWCFFWFWFLLLVTSSFSRGTPKLSSTSTQVRSSAQESKPYGLICPRENPHAGNFRVPSTRPVQPRLVRPTSSVGNAFGREQHGAAGIRAGPRFTGPLRGEKNRTETSTIPTSVCDGQSTRNFVQRSLMSNNNVHPLQTRSNKDIMTIEKVSLPANSRSGIPQRKASTRVTPPQLINSEYSVSSLIKRRHLNTKPLQ